MGREITMSIMSKLKKLLIIACTVSFFACTENDEYVCMDNVAEDIDITEKLAIQLSEEALIKKGFDIKYFSPVPYWDSSPELFARNEYDRNSGYMLWHKNNEKTLFEYSINIQKKDTMIYCRVRKVK